MDRQQSVRWGEGRLARTTAGRDLACASRACPEMAPGPQSTSSWRGPNGPGRTGDSACKTDVGDDGQVTRRHRRGRPDSQVRNAFPCPGPRWVPPERVVHGTVSSGGRSSARQASTRAPLSPSLDRRPVVRPPGPAALCERSGGPGDPVGRALRWAGRSGGPGAAVGRALRLDAPAIRRIWRGQCARKNRHFASLLGFLVSPGH